jgi:hypothetical protein
MADRPRLVGRLILGLVVLAALALSLARLVDRPTEEPPAGQALPSEQSAPAARSARAWRGTLAEQARRREEQEQRERAALRAAVEALVNDYEMCGVGSFLDTVGPGGETRLIGYIRANGNVQDILRFAEESAEHAEYVREMALSWLDAYLNEFDPWGNPDAPWSPTQLHPGGVIALPYVLRQLDAADSIPTLAAVWKESRRQIRAAQERRAGRPLQFGRPTADDFGTVLAYACDHFLSHWTDDPERARLLTDAQREILAEYAAWRAKYPKLTGEEPSVHGPIDYEGPANLSVYQVEVLAYAERFVAALEAPPSSVQEF